MDFLVALPFGRNVLTSSHCRFFLIFTKMQNDTRKKRICYRTEGEKGRGLNQSLDKKPYTHRKNPKSNVTTQKTPQKTSIKQLLRTDLGRSVGVITVTSLVWLNRFTSAQPSNLRTGLCQVHRRWFPSTLNVFAILCLLSQG